ATDVGTSTTASTRRTAGAGAVVVAILLLVAVVVVADRVSGVLFVRSVLVIAAIAVGSTVLLHVPRRLIVGVLVWLTFLGLARRLLSSGVGTVTNDPLLLLAPAVLIGLLAAAAQGGRLKVSSAPAVAVLVLCGLAVLSVLNPLAGAGAAALAGLLFFLVPLLWTWVGWAYLDAELVRTILRVVALLSLVAAGYALLQVHLGFWSFDQEWVDSSGYAALHLSKDTVRPFAMFASAQELGIYLSAGVVVWLFGPMWCLPRWARLGAVVLLGSALLASGSRGAIVLTVLAVLVAWAVRRGISLVPAALV
ncbi:hypothetical protein B7486_63340, partial [cyanobacterium TDX16]